MKDRDIIQSIREGRRERPIRKLYKEYPKIERLAVSSGLGKDDAREIFNDSLLLLIEKILDTEFTLTSKLTTYLYGINRFMVTHELRKQRRIIELEWTENHQSSQEAFEYDIEKEERLQQLERVLLQVSDRCRVIFELFYFKKKSMKEIAEILGYSTVNSAKTQKYKCIEQAHKLSGELQISNSKVNAS